MGTEKALEYVQRARAIGREQGLVVSVAVHDSAGHPIVVIRGGWWHGPYMAMGKARLAAAFRRPTVQLVEMWQERPLFPQSLMQIIPGGITVNAGGYPILENGQVIGAIGIGGGTPEQDDLVARIASGWQSPAEDSPAAPEDSPTAPKEGIAVQL